MLVTSPAKCYEVKLQHLSTVYLPHSFSGNTPQYAFDADAVEKAAFDPRGKIVYAVGALLLLLFNALIIVVNELSIIQFGTEAFPA